MQTSTVRLGVIGGGVMAEAMVSRLLMMQVYAPQAVLVSDVSQGRLEYWQRTYQVQVAADNQAAAGATECVLLAIKPQVLTTVVSGLSLSTPSTERLIVSILAGVPLQKLEAVFPGQSVVRAMPNAPATVGAGMTALAAGQGVAAEQLRVAQRLFEAVGQVVVVPESLMDAVTGLSGSGPAFVAIAIEALTDGGVAAGLPRAVAHQLAVQTVQGTATLIQDGPLPPAELKDRVTSPGGTTIAGITALERAGFRSALIEAVLAATQRSQALGNQ